jgi:hypothetical protein
MRERLRPRRFLHCWAERGDSIAVPSLHTSLPAQTANKVERY